jgi:hypothetical protein
MISATAVRPIGSVSGREILSPNVSRSGKRYSRSSEDDRVRFVVAIAAIVRGWVDESGARMIRNGDSTDRICEKILAVHKRTSADKGSSFAFLVNGRTYSLIEIHPYEKGVLSQTHLHARVVDVSSGVTYLVRHIPYTEFLPTMN